MRDVAVTLVFSKEKKIHAKKKLLQKYIMYMEYQLITHEYVCCVCPNMLCREKVDFLK